MADVTFNSIFITDWANYAAIKARLVAGAQTPIVSIDDPDSAAIAPRLAAAGRPVEMISVTGNPVTTGVSLDGTSLLRHRAGQTTPLADLADVPALRGAHNAQNAAAAALALGADADDLARLQDALRSFPGLAHRMEQVGRLKVGSGGHVLFINDSKATNADAAEKALLSFPRVHWIIGGKAKAGGIEPLRPLFPRVARAYLIGAASDAFAATLGSDVPFTACGMLDVATRAAAADAAIEAERTGTEQVVLLSPACASQDQFPDFEKRGDLFRDVVTNLIATG